MKPSLDILGVISSDNKHRLLNEKKIMNEVDINDSNSDLIFNKSKLPHQISGTNFVLISKMRPPNKPKKRIEPKVIKPTLVDTMGSQSKRISGLHTSQKSKTFNLRAKNAKDQNNLLPTASRQVQTIQRKVPKPSKVVGELNLDNFFRPANVSKTTHKPFITKVTSVSEDYYYYDYYVYDSPPEKRNTKINGSISASSSNHHKPIVVQNLKVKNNSINAIASTTPTLSTSTSTSTTTTSAPSIFSSAKNNAASRNSISLPSTFLFYSDDSEEDFVDFPDISYEDDSDD